MKSLKEIILAHLHTKQTKLSEKEQCQVCDCLLDNKFYIGKKSDRESESDRESDEGYILSGNKIAMWEIQRSNMVRTNNPGLQYYKDGKEHREGDLPAIIYFYKDGTCALEKWRKNGMSHRHNDQPAYIMYYKNGNVRQEVWSLDDYRYRRDKPADIIYYRNGTKKIVRYYWAGKNLSHNGLPAKITYYPNGEVKSIVHKYLPTLPNYEPEEIDLEDESCDENTDSETDDESNNEPTHFEYAL